MLLKWIFVILHVITGAAWFGLGLRLAAQARLAATAPGGGLLATDGQRTVRFMGAFLVLTLVFSLIAFFAGGGFSVYGPQYHTSITLLLIMIGLHYLLVRPAWNKLTTATGQQPVATDVAESSRKRVAIATGIGHLLWLTILVLMFWKYIGPLL